MGLGTTVGSVAVVLGASSLLYLRRRISKNWIASSSIPSTDLSGKLVVITGGNVGLGFQAAKDLANRNARVLLACRNIETGQEAVSVIQGATGNDAVECLELDLASLSSVRMFCSELKTKYPPIDVLVLNAGVWVPMEQKQTTKDGHEIHFGVNHLSHYEIVRLLGNHMAHDSSRIVFVSSSLAKSGQLDFESLDFVHEGRTVADDSNKKASFAPTGYCDSKLMNALTCRQLATRLPPHVTTYSVCPGFCRSRLGRNVTFPLYKKFLVAPIMLLLQRTAAQGAQNIVFISIEDKDNLTSGGFYRDGEIETKVSEYMDSLGSDTQEELWNLSEKLVTTT